MKGKLWVLVVLMILSFLIGVFGQYYYPGMEFSPIDLWTLPIFSVLIFLWYRMDTEEKSYSRSPWLNIAVVGFSIIALTYYFFRSRGFKGGLVATAVAVVLCVSSGVLTIFGQYGAYYGLQR